MAEFWAKISAFFSRMSASCCLFCVFAMCGFKELNEVIARLKLRLCGCWAGVLFGFRV